MGDRLRMMWCILTGRPVMFRVTVEGGTISFDGARGGHFGECHFKSIIMIQEYGQLPIIKDMICAAHEMTLKPDAAGNLICPMDGEVVFEAPGGQE